SFFSCIYILFFFFFFFQAEDGIRYRTVTGVQTCALPILVNKKVNVMFYLFTRIKLNKNWLKEIKFIYFLYIYHLLISLSNFFLRSEERRVGKECRFRC